MTARELYKPGKAGGAHVEKTGETWALFVIRDLKHPPEKVWHASTEPGQLSQWAPFDADKSLATAGNTVSLSTVGTPTPQFDWPRLNAEYGAAFGVEAPVWTPQA